MHDLGFAWRRVRKSPGFTASAVLILALGIGANTAIFSVLYAAYFTPYPLHEPDRVLRLYGEDTRRNVTQLSFSIPKFELARIQPTAFTSLEAANANTAFTILDDGVATQVSATRVTAGFLDTFGARPIIGRFFRPEEEKSPSVAIISETLWRGRFGGSQDVLGQAIILSGQPFTIIGVAPNLPAVWNADVWLSDPLQFPGVPSEVLQRGVSFLSVIGRLKPAVTPGQANRELEIIAGRYRSARPDNADAAWSLVAFGLRDDIVGASRGALFTLLGAVGLVLLLACANVTNLLLVRFSARNREIALRTALGAPRWRVLRQFLAESLLVSLLAGAGGAAAAFASMPALTALTQGHLSFAPDIGLRLPVLGSTLAVALLTGIAMGLYPALQASRSDLVTGLHEGDRTTTAGRGHRRARNFLVTGQVAVSMLLLVTAALLVGSLAWLQRQPPGYDATSVFTANISLPVARYAKPDDQARFFVRLAEAMRQSPGVQSAALIQGIPLSGNNSRAPYARAEGDVPPLQDRPLGLTRSVTPGYFEALRIPLLSGRDFDQRDTLDAPLVVILSRDTARRLFPGEDPLGRPVIMGSRGGGETMQVIGVVGDVRSVTLASTAAVEFYRPVTQRALPFMQLAVRTQGDAAVFAMTARQVLRSFDPELALNRPKTLENVLAESLGQQRLLVRLVGLFAALALALSMVGIYSVVASSVGQRKAELGVRMALGARPRDILGLAIAQGMMPVIVGLALGIAGCVALGRLIQNQLYGVSSFDAPTLAGAGLALGAVAVVACWVPARRAARIDPVKALRTE